MPRKEERIRNSRPQADKCLSYFSDLISKVTWWRHFDHEDRTGAALGCDSSGPLFLEL